MSQQFCSFWCFQQKYLEFKSPYPQLYEFIIILKQNYRFFKEKC